MKFRQWVYRGPTVEINRTATSRGRPRRATCREFCGGFYMRAMNHPINTSPDPQQQPDFVEARYNLGAILMNEGQLHEAAAQFQRAVELRPGLFKPASSCKSTCTAEETRIRIALSAVCIKTKASGTQRSVGQMQRPLCRNSATLVPTWSALKIRLSQKPMHDARFVDP